MKKVLFFYILLFALEPYQILANTESSDPLFSWEGKKYSFKDLPASIRQAYYDIEAKASAAKQSLFDEAIFKKHLEALASKKGKSLDYVTDKLTSVSETTEAEAKTLYDSIKGRVSATYEEIKKDIKERIQQNKERDKVQSIIEEQKAEGNFVSYAPVIEPPIFNINVQAFPSKGKSTAPVQIIEFADYRCGYCKKAKSSLKSISKQYRDKVQVVTVDYPLLDGNQNGISSEVTKGAFCAGKQNKYWEFNEEAFKLQSSLNNDSPNKIAKQLRLNTATFNQCMVSKSAEDHVKAARNLGSEYAVFATPTFFVNGQKVHIAQDFTNDLKEAIDKNLRKTKHKQKKG